MLTKAQLTARLDVAKGEPVKPGKGQPMGAQPIIGLGEIASALTEQATGKITKAQLATRLATREAAE